MVSLSTYTKFPYKTVVVGQVISKKPHKKWNICEVEYGGTEPALVVCGGTDYDVGDKVGYVPVGGEYKGKPADPKEIGGVMSNGVIMGALELGIDLGPLPDIMPAEQPEEECGGKKKKKKKKKKAKPIKQKDNRILILDPSEPIGKSLIEVGRIRHTDDLKIPDELGLFECLSQRKKEIGEVLQRLEHGEKWICDLWDTTKVWSLDAFKEIYKWLDCRFDVDFYESQCSEMSRDIVDRFYEKGVFVDSEGAVGCPLDDLPFCLLLKSNGTGLYATKDIALAELKFSQYSVDKSIYIVDSSQALHFQQVFATLNKMGFEQAEKCVHVPYNMVSVPGGKMGSRYGNVILFNELRQNLGNALNESYIDGLDFPESEKEIIRHACSVGSIRYGMLNHDVAKQIVFDLDKWTAVSGGDTGPYLMMQYTRVRSIQRNVQADPNVSADYKLLNDDKTQDLLLELSEFQNKITQTLGEESGDIPNPSRLCSYLFGLCQKFSSFYAAHNIKHEPDPVKQKTLLKFVGAFSVVLGRGLELLGISRLERM